MLKLIYVVLNMLMVFYFAEASSQHKMIYIGQWIINCYLQDIVLICS